MLPSHWSHSFGDVLQSSYGDVASWFVIIALNGVAYLFIAVYHTSVKRAASVG